MICVPEFGNAKLLSSNFENIQVRSPSSFLIRSRARNKTLAFLFYTKKKSDKVPEKKKMEKGKESFECHVLPLTRSLIVFSWFPKTEIRLLFFLVFQPASPILFGFSSFLFFFRKKKKRNSFEKWTCLMVLSRSLHLFISLS